MANAITINGVDRTQGKLRARGTIAFSGSYTQYASGGEILDFTKATLPLGKTLANSTGPVGIQITSSNGYNYQTPASLPQSTNPLQVPLKISTASATELSAGAYPAGITGDNVTFEAEFPSLT
jgi:hypothetical protein